MTICANHSNCLPCIIKAIINYALVVPIHTCTCEIYIIFLIYREVIERKPEEFKILSLQQIRMFFPDDYNPFHAGFGNKPSVCCPD